MTNSDLQSTVLSTVDEIFTKSTDEYIDNPSKFVNDVFRRLESNFLYSNENEVVPGRLVRLRCMIQDSRGTEYVNMCCDIKRGDNVERCSMVLRDTLDCNEEELVSSNGTIGRHCYLLVEVPGATEWFLNEQNSTGEPALKKECHPEIQSIPKVVAKFIGSTGEDLAPNSVVDVYGFVSSHAVDTSEESVSTNVKDTLNLHVLKHTVIGHKSLPKDIMTKDKLTVIRAKLTEMLNCIFGDLMTARWLIAHLISTTYARPQGLPVCSVPLNLVGLTNSRIVVDTMKALLPKVKHLVFNSSNLSDKPFAPVKNYDNDILCPGELQLSNGTELIIDETEVTTTSFPVNGHAEENLRVLDQLVTEQRIQFDYKFYKVPFDVDIPVLILSKRKSKFFKTPYAVPCNVGKFDVDCLGGPEELRLFRNYIQHCRAKVESVRISESIAQTVEDDFVAISKTLPNEVDKAELLHQLMTIARLNSTAAGVEEMGLEDWQLAIEMMKCSAELMTSWESQNK